jgi:hypothetical protein
MEFNKIELLVEKYFEGETTIADEKELKDYFTSSNVAPHLQHYQPMFGYYALAKEQKYIQKTPFFRVKSRLTWLSVAASVVVLLGVGAYSYWNTNPVKSTTELGTYEDPEQAFEATQKALAMLSNNVNKGVDGLHYIQVYENTKNRAFVE